MPATPRHVCQQALQHAVRQDPTRILRPPTSGPECYTISISPYPTAVASFGAAPASLLSPPPCPARWLLSWAMPPPHHRAAPAAGFLTGMLRLAVGAGNGNGGVCRWLSSCAARASSWPPCWWRRQAATTPGLLRAARMGAVSSGCSTCMALYGKGAVQLQWSQEQRHTAPRRLVQVATAVCANVVRPSTCAVGRYTLRARCPPATRRLGSSVSHQANESCTCCCTRPTPTPRTHLQRYADHPHTVRRLDNGLQVTGQCLLDALARAVARTCGTVRYGMVPSSRRRRLGWGWFAPEAPQATLPLLVQLSQAPPGSFAAFPWQAGDITALCCR